MLETSNGRTVHTRVHATHAWPVHVDEGVCVSLLCALESGDTKTDNAVPAVKRARASLLRSCSLSVGVCVLWLVKLLPTRAPSYLC